MSKRNKTPSRPGSLLLRMLPGLLITVLAVVALVYLVDLNELQRAFSLADFSTLPMVVLLFFGTVAARAMAWRTTLQEQASFRDCFFVLNQGYLLNNVLPFRLGELGRALLLGGRVGLSFWRVLPSIVVERIFDLGFAAALLLVTLPYVVGAGWASSAGVVVIVLVLAGFAMLFIMAARPEWALRLAKYFTGPVPRFQKWLLEQLKHFLEGLTALKQPSRFLRIAFWMTLTWFFNVAWYYTLLRAFLPQAEWLWAFFSIAAASMGVAVPSSPAYIGVFEAAILLALAPFGVEASVALAYALVAHVLYFVITAVLGIIGFLQQGQSLGSIYSQLLNRSAAK